MLCRKLMTWGLAAVGGLTLILALVQGPSVSSSEAKAEPAKPAGIDFARKIRPIFSENCFTCHGPDTQTRKAKLRLDTKEGAFAKLRSGGFAIVPWKSAESEMIARITAADDTHMPPLKSGKKLTGDQINLLRQWIDQGAQWSEHWAFVPPRKPAVPTVKDSTRLVNPIDHFIASKLEAAGLKSAAEADRVTLIRRVTLDLTGLPPTPAEVEAFVSDKSPNAYEKVVDRLLLSPRFGEHMARYWLDAARYGDTHGLHIDNYREIWPYREWVIKAFNANKPFDKFVIEQLAGDLLPQPTLDQIVATGYNRCHVSTHEGGSIEEEVYVRNVVDQVDTNGSVFLGMAVGCARCHDHKFDPITQKEYYQLFAYFNSIDGVPLDGNIARHAPIIKVPTPEQSAKTKQLRDKIGGLYSALAAEVAKVKFEEQPGSDMTETIQKKDYVWIDDAFPAGSKAQGDFGPKGQPPFVAIEAQHPVYKGAKSLHLSFAGQGQIVCEQAPKGLRVGEGDRLFAYVFLDPSNPPKEIMLQWHTDDWKHRAYWGENLVQFGRAGTSERRHSGPLPEPGRWVRLEVEAAKVGIKAGSIINGWAFTQHGGTAYWDCAGILTAVPQTDQPFDSMLAWLRVQRAIGGAGLTQEIKDLVMLDPAKRTDVQNQKLRAYFLEYAYAKTRGTFDPLHRILKETEKQLQDVDNQMSATLIFKERSQPRPAYVLKRGDYDKRGDQVERGTPAFLPPLPSNLPRNRLGFAQWLMAPGHPLTSRVAVNRFWQQCFGTGLVKTTEDFGSQGEPPSHPQLLDWLAVQFVEDGWDVKKFMKRMVMSGTYRQSAKVSPELAARDPANRLLARGPRFRLDAEMLRDQALSVSGLLVEKIGGPSVKPPQPSGLWEAVSFMSSDTGKFVADKGNDVHRRSLYTFWKRTSPPPQMTTFDAPSRESCILRRERTNTPLQALVLMNETQFIESARALGERVMHQGGANLEARLSFMFKLVTCRAPDGPELAELTAVYKDHLAAYVRDVEAAKKLIQIGESKPDAKLNPSELAAYTMVANLLFNLDVVLNKG